MENTIKLEDQSIDLTPTGSWQQKRYFLDKKSAYAIKMAVATNRPLLVKGEPGLGKSYLALAAAKILDRAFISEVINSYTEGQELLYKDNPIQRLSDAQTKADAQAKKPYKAKNLHPANYINPGVLWWAFNWQSAEKQYEKIHYKIYKPNTVNEQQKQNGIVLLIDEIDKADSSLPNSLLEVLGNGGFDVPLANVTVGANAENQAKTPAPLVIITSNDERELPPAFVRRCLVLHLKMPDAQHEQENQHTDNDNQTKYDLTSWLITRVRVHVDEADCHDKMLIAAAKLLSKDRIEAEKQGNIKPGLSEYIDLISALVAMTSAEKPEKREQAQRDLLKEIAEFSLKKAKG